MTRWNKAALDALDAGMTWDQFSVEFPDITYNAWETKRRRLRKDGAMQLGSSIEQAVKNNIKLARHFIRVRHSIQADDELSLVIPRIRAALQGQAQNGLVTGLSLDDLRGLIYGE